MSKLLLSLLIGAGLGAALGRLNRCSTGACPLTANWKRGTLYGAVLGLMFYFASSQGDSIGRSRNVKPVTGTDFDAEVTRAGKPVVVDFFATWCGPCKILAPRLDKLAGEYGDRIKFVSVNVDQSPALAGKFNVEGVPTLVFIGRDGKVAETSVGLLSEETLRARLETLSVKPD